MTLQPPALKHGAAATEVRVTRGLPLASDDKLLHDEIINQLGYDSGDMPPGAMGLMIGLIADNVLLSVRFKSARHWAAEQGDLERYVNLSQRSGWRNDRSIKQLLSLVELQAKSDNLIIDALGEFDDSGD